MRKYLLPILVLCIPLAVSAHDFVADGIYYNIDDTTQQPDVKPYFFVKDYLGNVRLTCDGNTGEVLQSLEYFPSGVPYNRVNPSMQPRRFCGKEEVELHGFDMYDSGARWQYSLIPRFSTIDPLAEKYYHLSPYAYCAGDPVNLVDPDGDTLLRESVILFAQLSLCSLSS